MNVLRCRPEVFDDAQFLAADMSVKCYTSSHVVGIVFAVLVALVYNIGIPILLVWYLHRRRHSLTDPATVAKYGFIYSGYSVTRGRYWWEAVQLLKKFSLLVVAGVITDPWYQALAGIALLLASLLIHIYFVPYERPLFNLIETISIVVLLITQLGSLLYLRAEVMFPARSEGRKAANVIVTLVLASLNAGFIILLVILFLRYVVTQQRSKSRRTRVLQAQAGQSQRSGLAGSPFDRLKSKQRSAQLSDNTFVNPIGVHGSSDGKPSDGDDSNLNFFGDSATELNPVVSSTVVFHRSPRDDSESKRAPTAPHQMRALRPGPRGLLPKGSAK